MSQREIYMELHAIFRKGNPRLSNDQLADLVMQAMPNVSPLRKSAGETFAREATALDLTKRILSGNGRPLIAFDR